MSVNRKSIFISAPYTHKDDAVKALRVQQAEEYFVKLLSEGYAPLSPVVTGHHLVLDWKIPGTVDYWMHYCKSLIQMSATVHVLQLPGWMESPGVAEEIEFANELGLVIEYIDLRDLDLSCTLRQRDVIQEYSEQYLAKGSPELSCICTLCGNSGVIDTRGTAVTGAGINVGSLNYCICANGRDLRERNILLEDALRSYKE